MSEVNDKACEHCGKPLQRKEVESLKNFARRRYCDLKCAGMAGRSSASNEAVYCQSCGKVIQPKSGESPSHTARRHFCDRRCMAAKYRSSATNEHALDELTPEACYWIGFLFADGCITYPKGGRQPLVRLGLAAEDAGHVEKFRAFFGSNAEPTHRPPRKMRNGYTSQSLVTASAVSQHLVSVLESYGFRKNPRWAAVPELVNSRDFWRGCIDGDGSIGLIKRFNLPTVYLCGHYELLSQFASFLRLHCPDCPATIHPEGTIFRVKTTTASDALTLLDVLYTDCTVALDRKYDLAMELLRTRPNRQGRERKLIARKWREIGERYLEGESVEQLVADYGHTIAHIYQIINRLGIPLRGRPTS